MNCLPLQRHMARIGSLYQFIEAEIDSKSTFFFLVILETFCHVVEIISNRVIQIPAMVGVSNVPFIAL